MREETPRTSLRQELAHNLQIGLGTGLIGGGLLGFLSAASSLALHPELLASAGTVLRLLLGLQAIYAVLCLALGMTGALFKTLFFLLTRRSISDTKTSGGVAWLVFFLIGGLYGLSWARWQKIAGLTPSTPIAASPLPVLLSVAALSALLASVVSYAFYLLLVYYKKPERRRPRNLRRAFLLLAYMAGVFILFLIVMRFTTRGEGEGSGLTADLINRSGRPIRVLAIDGLDRSDVEWLRGEHRLAWTDSLLAGSVGTLVPPETPVPPMDWTLVATGRSLAAHGITDFQTQIVRGLPIPLAIGPEQIGLFELVQNVLPFLRMTRTVPVKSWMRETKGLWNMATDAGLRSVVVNWWVSWPAERVRGAIVSDHAWMKLVGEGVDPFGDDPEARAGVAARVAASVQTTGRGMVGARSPLRPDGQPLLLERETWPPTLLIELTEFAQPTTLDSLDLAAAPGPTPSEVAAFERLGIPGDVLRADCFYARCALHLLERDAPALWMLHLPGPDVVRRMLARAESSSVEREVRRREALRVYWQVLDRTLSSWWRVASSRSGDRPPNLCLWVTLPGLPWEAGDGRRDGGVLALAGTGARPGSRSEPFQLAEIAPTLLWLLGMPVARDMEAGPRTDLVTGALAAELSPIRWVPSYGRQEIEGLEQAAGSLDEEMLERFRSLGYIQ